jgi:2-hydroxychromene-2-carboxylate isomerase
VDDLDISSPDTVLDIADRLGIDREQLAAALQAPEVKARLKEECEQALAAGVFGSPHDRRWRAFLRRRPFAADRTLAADRRFLSTP